MRIPYAATPFHLLPRNARSGMTDDMATAVRLTPRNSPDIVLIFSRL